MPQALRLLLSRSRPLISKIVGFFAGFWRSLSWHDRLVSIAILVVVATIWLQHRALNKANVNIERLTAEIVALKNDKKISELDGKISVIKSQIDEQQNKIAQLRTDIDKKKSDVTKPYVSHGMTSNEIAKGFRSLKSN